jgi:putative spermidine/putrescine transport system ATP-binding protein
MATSYSLMHAKLLNLFHFFCLSIMGLNVHSISKRFGNVWALRDVAMTVEHGEIFGILGPSGSGKSVLLDILSGGMQPGSGTFELIESNGNSSISAKLVRPSVEGSQRSFLSRLFSSPDVSVTISPNDLDTVITNAFENAAVVLLDEPFASLGQEERDHMAQRLRNLAQATGTSVIFASGSFYDICRTCDRAGILIDGEIPQTGTPNELYDGPLSQRTALLTGRMNFFEGRRLSSSKAEIPEFMTINGEHRIFTKRSGLRRLGAMNRNVVLGIRPEDVHISFGASFPADNLLRAVVSDARFFGAYTLVTLDAGGLMLQAQVNKLVGLGVGEECVISLPPERIHYL